MSTPTIKDISMYWLYRPETPYVKITLTIRGSGFTRRHRVHGMPLPKSPTVSRAYVKQWIERYAKLKGRSGGLPLDMRVFDIFRHKLHSERLIVYTGVEVQRAPE